MVVACLVAGYQHQTLQNSYLLKTCVHGTSDSVGLSVSLDLRATLSSTL